MAATAAYSNRCLFFPPLPPSRKPPRAGYAITFSTHQNPRRLSLFASSQIPRRHGVASLKVAGSDQKTINGDEDNKIMENEADDVVDPADLPPMEMLIQSFKMAVLDGDERSVSEVEAAINIMENKKNELSVKFLETQAEITSGKDKFLRLKANFENFRKRSENDRLAFTSDIRGDVLENLLPMVDSFERAKQQLKPETEKEKSIHTSYQGIYKQFVDVLRSYNVAVVETIGKPFNPSIHEAIAREASQEFREGIVMQEVRRGFVLGDRLLRAATVKVSTGLRSAKSTSDSGNSTKQAAETVQQAEDEASAMSNN